MNKNEWIVLLLLKYGWSIWRRILASNHVKNLWFLVVRDLLVTSVRMELCDNATLALSVSSTTQDVLIHLLMQKRREFLSASKFVSQLLLHSWSKTLPYCWFRIKNYPKCAFRFQFAVHEIYIYVIPSPDYILAKIQNCSHFAKLTERKSWQRSAFCMSLLCQNSLNVFVWGTTSFVL
jgi:hypothetical protein